MSKSISRRWRRLENPQTNKLDKPAHDAVGLGVSFATNRLLASQLFGLSPHDPLLLLTVSGVLLFVALLASFLPACRASQVDPVEALRYE